MMLPTVTIKESMVTYVNKLENLINEISVFPADLYSEIMKLNIEGAAINGSPKKTLGQLLDENLSTF